DATAPPRAEFDPAGFGNLQAAQDRHFWFRHRNRVIEAVLGRLRGGLTDRARVIEVGCGTGNALRVLERACRPARVIGLDFYEEGLEYARRNVGCELIRGDVRSIPVPGTFELICAFDVIEHLADDVDVLAALRDRLTPGAGRVFVTVPAHMSLWSYFDEAACHCRRYTTGTLRGALERAGYAVEYLTYFMFPLYPLIWVGRRAAALQAKVRPASIQDLTRQELQVVPVVNGLLGALLRTELPVIRAG